MVEPLPILSAILAQLQQEGYTEDFNLSNRYLAGQCPATLFSSPELVVDQYFCLAGNPGPHNEAVVYAISLPKFNLKGTLVSAYGVYSDAASDELVKALQRKTAAGGATLRGVPAQRAGQKMSANLLQERAG